MALRKERHNLFLQKVTTNKIHAAGCWSCPISVASEMLHITSTSKPFILNTTYPGVNATLSDVVCTTIDRERISSSITIANFIISSPTPTSTIQMDEEAALIKLPEGK